MNQANEREALVGTMLTIISMLNTIIDRLDMSADRIDGMYNRAEKYFQDLNTAFTRDIIQAEVERHRAMNAQREKENKDKGRCK